MQIVGDRDAHQRHQIGRADPAARLPTKSGVDSGIAHGPQPQPPAVSNCSLICFRSSHDCPASAEHRSTRRSKQRCQESNTPIAARNGS
jgi:hypothetical protein